MNNKQKIKMIKNNFLDLLNLSNLNKKRIIFSLARKIFLSLHNYHG